MSKPPVEKSSTLVLRVLFGSAVLGVAFWVVLFGVVGLIVSISDPGDSVMIRETIEHRKPATVLGQGQNQIVTPGGGGVTYSFQQHDDGSRLFRAPSTLSLALLIGLGLALTGTFVLRRRFSLRTCLVLVMLSGLLSSIPFFVLGDDRSRAGPAFEFSILVPVQLSASRIEDMRRLIAPPNAMASLPAGWAAGLDIDDTDRPTVELGTADETSSQTRVRCSVRFSNGVDAPKRSALVEFFFYMTETLVLDAAREQGFTAQRHVTSITGDFHAVAPVWEKSRPRLPRSSAPANADAASSPPPRP